jgi:hypothetical protein
MPTIIGRKHEYNKEKTEAVLDGGRRVDIEANDKKIIYSLMSRHHATRFRINVKKYHGKLIFIANMLLVIRLGIRVTY